MAYGPSTILKNEIALVQDEEFPSFHEQSIVSKITIV